MKRSVFLFCTSLAIYGTACNNSQQGNPAAEKHFPAPGTVVARAEIPIAGDSLNNFSFSVKVVADSDVTSGVYDIDADYGPNFAEGQIVLPKGGEDFTPAIRCDTAPYTFIIGFRMKNDTTFYDYFRVSSSNKVTKMQYIKSYSFE